MKCSLDISNFLEEICSLSHCVVFIYFFALVSYLSYLSLLFFALVSYLSLLFFGNLHSDGYIFPFLLCLSLLFFLSYLYGLLKQPFCLFAFLFLGDGLKIFLSL